MDLRQRLARLTASAEPSPRPVSSMTVGTAVETAIPAPAADARASGDQRADLLARLAQLRLKAHSAISGPAPAAPALADRLARLRVGPDQPRDRKQAISELVRITGAEQLADDLLVVERRYPLPHRHGRVHLGRPDGAPLNLALRRDDVRAFAPERVLFLDTETSGLAGGTGTLAFLVGLARFEADALVVRQYLLTGFGGEAAMLAAVREAVAEAECLVTFNGKTFDVPLLRTRYTLARARHPFDEIAHCDLLHVTRRELRSDWPDCRLRTAEERALGFFRVDDLPGSEVPAAFQRWLRLADGAAVPRILDHNREDLVSLAALLAVLAEAPSRGRRVTLGL